MVMFELKKILWELISISTKILQDRFDPIADASTSRLDLIPHMVYG